MPLGYQQRDHEIVDYQEYRLTPHFMARGPEPRSLDRGQYFACVGAAQTFGCFCDAPYPARLQQQIGIDALNLGRAGAGPKFFLNDPRLLALVNGAAFVIVQVMSGRSEDNSFFRSGGLEWLHRRSDGSGLSAEIAYKDLLAHHDEEVVRHIVSETRANWIASFKSLLQAVQPRKILFWFSQRQPDYVERLDGVHRLFGEFPQLVNAAMVEAIKPYADEYVECVSSRGMPQMLRSRFTGQPAVVDYTRKGEEHYANSSNTYYPSPEMHVDAADALHDACLRVSHSDWAFKPGTSDRDTGRVALGAEQILESLRHSLFARLTGIDPIAFAGDRRTITCLRDFFDTMHAPSNHQYISLDDQSPADWTRVIAEQRRVIVTSITNEEPLFHHLTGLAPACGVATPVLRLFADVFVNIACGDAPLHNPVEPRASTMRYAILGTPRCGSEFLCTTLTSTGAAGFPEEHLRLDTQLLTRYCGFDCTRYLRSLIARRTTSNGVFGTKIISHFLHDHLSRSPDLKRELAGFRFIHVVRRDRIGQAISALLASKTGIWHVRNDKEQANYRRLLGNVTIVDSDLQWIRWLAGGFERENGQLADFLAKNKLPAITVTYEDLIANPGGHLKSILSFLDLPAAPTNVSVPLKPTRSVLSESIRTMYLNSEYAGERLGLRSLFRAWRLWRQRTVVPVGAAAPSRADGPSRS